MVSVELDWFQRQTDECHGEILEFIGRNLNGVEEMWVGLDTTQSWMAKQLLGYNYQNIRQLRCIGNQPGIGSNRIPIDMAELTSVYCDRSANQLVQITEVIRRSQQTLRDLNIDEFTEELAQALGIHPDSPVVTYSQLHRLAIAHLPDEGQISGSAFPNLKILSFSQTQYPVNPQTGCNQISETLEPRLTQHTWPALQRLAIDGISQGDIQGLVRVPQLEVLSIGALDTETAEDLGELPVACLERLEDLGSILDRCPQLVDLRLETPEAFDELYNESVERPSQPLLKEIATDSHSCLRHLTVSPWALTFDQILRLLSRAPQLNCLECIVHFTARHPVTATDFSGGQHLSHLILLHSTGPKHRHLFKSNLLRFLSHLNTGSLKTLDIYGALELPGLECTLARSLDDCLVGVFPLLGEQ